MSSAREEAEQLLRGIDRATLPGAHAKALAVIAECLRQTNTQDEAADCYLAQAVALYLAIGEHDKATELSRALLAEHTPVPDVPEPPPNYGAIYI